MVMLVVKNTKEKGEVIIFFGRRNFIRVSHVHGRRAN